MVGQVPLYSEVGDMAAIFEGVPVPFVLRTEDEEERVGSEYRIVGACYVASVTDGKALEVLKGRGGGETRTMVKLV